MMKVSRGRIYRVMRENRHGETFSKGTYFMYLGVSPFHSAIICYVERHRWRGRIRIAYDMSEVWDICEDVTALWEEEEE